MPASDFSVEVRQATLPCTGAGRRAGTGVLGGGMADEGHYAPVPAGFVRLVSKDGFEFLVEEEYALASNVIKMMLNGKCTPTALSALQNAVINV